MAKQITARIPLILRGAARLGTRAAPPLPKRISFVFYGEDPSDKLVFDVYIPAIAAPRAEFPEDSEADFRSLEMTMDWQNALQEAIHESDPQVMNTKILAAETAIFTRIQDSSSHADALEQQALFDALGAIRILRSARRLSK